MRIRSLAQSSGRSARARLAHEISTRRLEKNLHDLSPTIRITIRPVKLVSVLFLANTRHLIALSKTLLHGTSVAMYIVGQERRLVDPPSQVVAGVRTVTTNMDGRDALPRMSRPFAFC